jgi:hypothetical protein
MTLRLISRAISRPSCARVVFRAKKKLNRPRSRTPSSTISTPPVPTLIRTIAPIVDVRARPCCQSASGNATHGYTQLAGNIGALTDERKRSRSWRRRGSTRSLRSAWMADELAERWRAGQSMGSIAESLGASRGAAAGKIFRARKRLARPSSPRLPPTPIAPAPVTPTIAPVPINQIVASAATAK